MGTLFVVSTPIGNLEDITARALRILSEVETIAAEDTRTARNLLSHFDIRNRLISYNEHNRRLRIPQLLRRLETGDLALISEAGTPAISDPGQELVAAAIAAGYLVSPVPGPSAPLAAIAVSGLPTRQFIFLGFLPRRPGERRSLLESLTPETRTMVCFEAPSRLNAALTDLLSCLGDRRIAICRELTKLHEEILRLRLSDAVALGHQPRGEYVLVIEGAAIMGPPTVDDGVRAELEALRAGGASAREATTRVAATHRLPRRLVYAQWLTLES